MRERDVSELGLLIFFLAVAGGFAALTTAFRSSSAALFPRITAGVIVGGVVLLLFERRLPEPLRRVVAEPVDFVDREEFEEFEDDSDPSGESASTGAGSAADGRLSRRRFTFLAIAGYVVGSYVLSILVATPLFMLGYGYREGHSRRMLAGLTLISIGICFAFIELANAPLDRGLLWSVVG